MARQSDNGGLIFAIIVAGITVATLIGAGIKYAQDRKREQGR